MAQRLACFEVLSTEEGGNQTITEGFFCTAGVVDCEVLG